MCSEWWDPSLRLSVWERSSEETSQRWRAVGDIASELTGPGIKPRPPAPMAMSVTTTLFVKFYVEILGISELRTFNS